jgi:hypothetical protein
MEVIESSDAFDALETWASEALDALATDALDGLVAAHAFETLDRGALACASVPVVTLVVVPACVLAGAPAEASAAPPPAMPERFDSIARSSDPERGAFHNATAAPPTPPRIDPVMNAALCR